VIHIHIFKGTDSNSQVNEEYKAPFLKNIEKIKNSMPVRTAKKHFNNFSKDFESKLNTESKKQVNGKNQECTLNI